MKIPPTGSTLPHVTHHRVALNGTDIHCVSAGSEGSPILLVHGFPETWWTFHKVIPLLAECHRVFAVDLRGFGDSGHDAKTYDSAAVAEDLHQLIAHLDVGPVHLTGQDIAGASVFRLAAAYPEDVASFTAIEMGLAAYGLEGLADVSHGGAWHIGVLAAPGIPDMLLAGHEQEFLTFMFNSMCATRDAVAAADISEFARSYSTVGGWNGAAGLYQSMLREGAEIRALAEASPLKIPVLAIGAGGGPFTSATLQQVAADKIRSIQFDGVGHYVALEAPRKLAEAIIDFTASVDITA